MTISDWDDYYDYCLENQIRPREVDEFFEHWKSLERKRDVIKEIRYPENDSGVIGRGCDYVQDMFHDKS